MHLVINFSYNAKDVSAVLTEYAKQEGEEPELLDFAALSEVRGISHIVHPSMLDKTGEIIRLAIQDYVEAMGRLSQSGGLPNGDAVRSVVFHGLPLYWLTAMSQKHPQYCVLKNLYYFKHLSSRVNLNNRIIMVVLPTTGLHFQQAIRRFFEKELKVDGTKVKFNGPVQTTFSTRGFISYLKVFATSVGKAKDLLPRPLSSSVIPNDVIFTFYPETWRGEENGDFVLKGIESFSRRHKRKAVYCPYISNLEVLANFKNTVKFDQNYFRAFPSTLQVLKLVVDLFSCYRKIQKLNIELDNVHFVDGFALKFELNDVLHHRMELFFNYVWFKNYLKGYHQPLNVYYQDEFYTAGRLLSHSINNLGKENLTGYGVQHGLFYEAHTVYRITDAELQLHAGLQGMPIPKKFVVWGEYFRRLFLATNSLPPEYTAVAGNLNYILSENELKPPAQTKPRSGKARILWCTALKVDLQNVYNDIFSKFARSEADTEIVLRFHPLINLRAYFENELLDTDLRDRFLISGHQSITEAIAESDLVVTSSGSTVFLDAIVASRPVFLIVNNDYYMGDFAEGSVTSISGLTEFLEAYAQFKTGERLKNTNESFLHFELSAWEKILKAA